MFPLSIQQSPPLYRVFEGVIGIDGVIGMAHAEALPPCSNWLE